MLWTTPALAESTLPAPIEDFVVDYCLDCHDSISNKANLDLEPLLDDSITNPARLEIWENVIRRLRTRQMPPPDKDRPSHTQYQKVIEFLTSDIDNHYFQNPVPEKTEALRRLTRLEYQNAIRDLFNLDIDVTELLPRDESSHGFDNITVGELSPTLLDRYISAARKISRIALGITGTTPAGHTERVKQDVTQEYHVEGLPPGTRGGTLFSYNFPASGEYEIRVHLSRDRNEHVEGLYSSHQMEIIIDKSPMASFTISPPPGRKDFTKVDEHLKARINVPAGPKNVGVTFIKKSSSLEETRRKPFLAHYNVHRHPRLSPAVFQVSITGPYGESKPDTTPSRSRIYGNHPIPTSTDDFAPVARNILKPIIQAAYRRPISDDDLERPMQFFTRFSQGGNFEEGIEMALSSILLSPDFLFKVESPTVVEGKAITSPARLPGIQLASRLSFFLWSSIPDSILLDAAVSGELDSESGISRQVRRMLKDPKADSFVRNFAGQWLYLRNLEAITPDLRIYPDFDDNLRQSMKRETELFFQEILNLNLPVTELLNADFTFINERLAKHYQIPGIYGSRFRKYLFSESTQRRGLLTHGSILTVTSYANRTSPVIRGNWILENILGTPTPPPPPNVPTLEDNIVSASLPIRERLKQHRDNPNCSVCHNLMDPVGFALENFDAIGRWRSYILGNSVDGFGSLPNGFEFSNHSEMIEALAQDPDSLTHTLTEKLMTYALGRGLTFRDQPAIRKIVSHAASREYKIQSIIHAITHSVPFRYKSTGTSEPKE